MGDYPNSDEEFELMYGDELELLREQEQDFEPSAPKSRKTLDFSTPSSSRNAPVCTEKESQNSLISTQKESQDLFEQSTSVDYDSCQHIPNSLLPEPKQQSTITQETLEPSNSKKRSIQDLFGDIDDLLFEDQLTSKKQKLSKDEQDRHLIEYISELRKAHIEKNSILGFKTQNTQYDTQRDKHNISSQIPKYPFVGIKRLDGERVYVRFHSEEYEKDERERLIQNCSVSGVLGDTFKPIWEEARQFLNTELDRVREMETNQQEIHELRETEQSKQLWVELYKPRKYLELLSDESTNRTMLRWMKLWDKVVFGRKPKVKEVKEENKGKNSFFKKPELSTKLDEYGRPEHKVALLCGPPGLGKTTLAHMVARHAGYNVVEINASDDRSTDAFKTALENSTQMRSVVDTEQRPNCIIFDEIDGAPQTSIDFLVKFISGTAPQKGKKKKDQDKTYVLKRPIICICNDVYVPALRPLRQIAFVVNFPATSSTRLAERLMEIARREQIKTDMGAMLALAEKSGNDIRSCLSVLHFFKAQNKPVTLSEVYRASIGQKDMQKGLFSVWQDVFQIERPKAKRGLGQTAEINLKTRSKKILNVVSAFGDYDRVSQGIFENYPNIRIKDTNLTSTYSALEWFCFFDMVSRQVYALQNYDLSVYLQYAFVVWHFVFGTMQKQKLQYPSQGYEARQKQTRNQALVAELLRGTQPLVRCFCKPVSLVLDISPFLTRIIVPPFRPVSLHLFTKEEKESLLRVVNIMIDYNLNYIQQRTPEGTYVYNLDPNIEELVISSSDTPKRSLSYPIRQVIAKEVDTEKMRRFEGPKEVDDKNKENRSKNSKSDVKSKENTKKVIGSPSENSALPNHLQTLKAKAQAKVVKKASPTVRKDFFGRVITSPTTSSGAGKTEATAPSNDVWYEYKEGYNNAVRKTILISDIK